MNSKWLLGITLIPIILLVALTGCGSALPDVGDISFDSAPSSLELQLDNQESGISVTGKGKTMAAPDIAIVRVGIEAQEATVAEAQLMAVEAMDGVMNALIDSGMEEKDIQTQYFKIRQVTRWDAESSESVVIGYQVANMVNAKIRDIDNTGAIVDAVAAAGGDLTRIDSIDFSIDEPEKYYDDVREDAVEDAREKAEQLANMAGVILGNPVYISETAQSSAPIYRAGGITYDKAMSIPETPISPGEMEISLSVKVRYEIIEE